MAKLGTATVKLAFDIDPDEIEDKAIEAIAKRVAELRATHPGPKLKLARIITLNQSTGALTIDGEPFGYYLADVDAESTWSFGEPVKLNVTLLAEQVVVL